VNDGDSWSAVGRIFTWRVKVYGRMKMMIETGTQKTKKVD
jgi:hypothetical protein